MTRIDAETLREWRRARGWDVPKMARQLRQASSEPIAAHEGLVRMIRAWEGGEHQLSERYELLYASALGVSPQQLHHGPRHQRQEDQPGVSGQPSGPYAPEVIAAIGEALHADQHSAPEDLHDPASVRSDILRAWELRQSAQYVRLGALLTGLLQDTAAWLASSPDDSQALDAATAAVHTQDMVSSLLKRLGAYEMAAIVADRAFRIGRQTGNALLIGAAQLRVARGPVRCLRPRQPGRPWRSGRY